MRMVTLHRTIYLAGLGLKVTQLKSFLSHPWRFKLFFFAQQRYFSTCLNWPLPGLNYKQENFDCLKWWLTRASNCPKTIFSNVKLLLNKISSDNFLRPQILLFSCATWLKYRALAWFRQFQLRLCSYLATPYMHSPAKSPSYTLSF